LLEEGVAMEVISKRRLRHSDLDTTARFYAHYTKKLDRVAKVGVARLIRES
jgi:hypothetical protein